MAPAAANDHGGQVWGPDGRRLVRLDFSASLWPEPRVPLETRLRNLLEPYPDADCRALLRAAALYYGVPAACIVPANGATEGLYLAMQLLRPPRLVLPVPAFSEYARAARWANPGVEILRLRTHPETGFAPPLADAGAGLCVLANPNNPTGVLVPRRRLVPWLDDRERAGSWTILDEAFIEFVAGAERHSLVRSLERWPHLLVLRSFTKRFGIAGLRLGFVLSARATAARLRALRIPWSVNALAQQLGIALARRRDPRLPDRIAALRDRLAARLARLGFEVFPSAANFLLVRTPGRVSNRPLIAALRRRGIALRDGATFAALDDSYLRIAVRPLPEMRALWRALESVL